MLRNQNFANDYHFCTIIFIGSTQLVIVISINRYKVVILQQIQILCKFSAPSQLRRHEHYQWYHMTTRQSFYAPTHIHLYYLTVAKNDSVDRSTCTKINHFSKDTKQTKYKPYFPPTIIHSRLYNNTKQKANIFS